MSMHTHAPTVLDQARAFFERNPDEILTRADIRLKWNCSQDMSTKVAKTLISEGVVRRDQIPKESRFKPTEATPFPDNLAPCERRDILAMLEHGTASGAAKAQGLSIKSIECNLKRARRKAGVKSTVDLLVKYELAVGE